MNSPLRVLFIWHHHQPYYKTDGTFLMPWVRMHGIKDYWDMVRMLDDYPGIRQTFNFAPSLLEQISEYVDGKATDRAFLLSEKDPRSFSDDDRVNAIRTFFLSNTERMIMRYPRYAELLALRGSVSTGPDLYAAAARFGEQDFRDLQVWWNLAWVGEYSRFDPPFVEFLEKQRNFTEEEKRRLLSAQRKILSKIVPHHVRAMKRGQVELSVSPFYHPIIPLLCDSSIAVKANDRAALPKNRFRFPEDAERQISAALEYGGKTFGIRPAGMWPSEGSVSDDAIALFAKRGVKWIATDEAILQKSLTMSGTPLSRDFLERYFPYNYTSGGKKVKVFFRDHGLSDKIGFVYSHWSPDDAARDFVSSLLKIRESLAAYYGEDALQDAVVPVILDGENAWEFYQSDGKDFLRTLYHLIQNEPLLETALPSDVTVRKDNTLRRISPGSWINGNFDIWIGHEEDNKAWDLLYGARIAYRKRTGKLSAGAKERAFRELMICEGSDWCWWYGDEHKSAQAAEFDELFRYHLKQVYSMLGSIPPAALEEPIKRRVERLAYRQPVRKISPKIGAAAYDNEWKEGGYVDQEQPTGAMDQSGVRIRRVRFGNDASKLYLAVETTTRLSGEKVVIELYSPSRMVIEIGKEITVRTPSRDADGSLSVHYSKGETLQVSIGSGKFESSECSLIVSVYDQERLLDSIPRQGVAKFAIVQ